VHKNKDNSGTAAGAATQPTLAALKSLLEKGLGPDRLCLEIAGIFRVRLTEIALLMVDDKVLRFLFPDQLGAMGTIPLSSSSIAAKTAGSRQLEIFNNFCDVKHATVFETVKLGSPHMRETSVQLPIQKLMSAPIFDSKRNVLGVLQVSRKGLYLSSAGSDFTPEDAQNLEAVTKILSRAPFLETSKSQ
jgi:hypothetical protein